MENKNTPEIPYTGPRTKGYNPFSKEPNSKIMQTPMSLPNKVKAATKDSNETVRAIGAKLFKDEDEFTPFGTYKPSTPQSNQAVSFINTTGEIESRDRVLEPGILVTHTNRHAPTMRLIKESIELQQILCLLQEAWTADRSESYWLHGSGHIWVAGPNGSKGAPFLLTGKSILGHPLVKGDSTKTNSSNPTKQSDYRLTHIPTSTHVLCNTEEEVLNLLKKMKETNSYAPEDQDMKTEAIFYKGIVDRYLNEALHQYNEDTLTGNVASVPTSLGRTSNIDNFIDAVSPGAEEAIGNIKKKKKLKKLSKLMLVGAMSGV